MNGVDEVVGISVGCCECVHNDLSRHQLGCRLALGSRYQAEQRYKDMQIRDEKCMIVTDGGADE